MSVTSNHAKYCSKNILTQIGIKNFFARVLQLLDRVDFCEVLDAGCGEGFVTAHLRKIYKERIRVTGIDKNYDALCVARSMNVFNGLVQGDIFRLPVRSDSFDLVVCTEVLEHLANVEDALIELKRVTRRYCLLSVPWEHLFQFCRLLGLNDVRRLGRHPEHVQIFNKTSFCKMVARYFHIEQARCSFPWIIVLCRK